MIFVADNFLKNPDEIRIDALKRYSSQSRVKSTNYPGIKFIIEDPIFKDQLKQGVSKIVNEKVTIVESCFQFVDKNFVKGIPHDDRERKYTSIIYLNQNPPKNSGTEIFEYCYHNRSILYKDEKFIISFKESFITKNNKNFIDKFLYSRLIDKILKEQKYKTVISNMYNRHLIFDSKLTHRAQNYFGEDKNSRLCLVSFFQ
jgi:hypothetical protein